MFVLRIEIRSRRCRVFVGDPPLTGDSPVGLPRIKAAHLRKRDSDLARKTDVDVVLENPEKTKKIPQKLFGWPKPQNPPQKTI